MKTEIVLERFRRGISPRMENCEGDNRLNGLIVDIDESTGHAVRVERLSVRQ